MRQKIEMALGLWGRFVARNPYWVMLLSFAVLAVLGTQLRHFRLDTSLENYFHATDPVLIEYVAYQDLFGRDAGVLIALKPREGVFEADFLDTLRSIHEEIERDVPLLEKVTSLVNVRETLGNADGLVVDDFLSIWPESEEALRAAEERALSNPLYRNFVLSADGRIASIVIEVKRYRNDEDADALAGFSDDTDATADEPVLTTGRTTDRSLPRSIRSWTGMHRTISNTPWPGFRR